MQLLTLTLFSVVFVTSNANDADILLQERFQNMDASLRPGVDTCLTQNQLQLTDLRMYSPTFETPEPHLCFYKCFYNNIGFLNDEGRFNTGNIGLVPQLSQLEDVKITQIIECVENLDSILQCTDLRNLEACVLKFL